MNPLSWFRPREHTAAARSYATLAGVAYSTTFLIAPFTEDLELGTTLILVVALFLVVAGSSALLFRCGPEHRWIWLLAAIGPVPSLVAFDLVTEDASVSGMVFFVFPALYGASQLRPAGAIAMSVMAWVGVIVVVTVLLPPEDAIVTAWFMGATIGTTASLLAVARSRQEHLVRELEKVAAVDALTGLSTRRVLDEAAASVLSGAGTDRGTALLLLDIDHFKAINDEHGHPGGDAVLVQMAGLLRGHSRRSDVVCRLGGDEIAILMPGCDESSATYRANEILTAIELHTFRSDHGHPMPVSVSAGCAHLPTHATDFRELYAAADAALYRSKQGGRGRLESAVLGAVPRSDPAARRAERRRTDES